MCSRSASTSAPATTRGNARFVRMDADRSLLWKLVFGPVRYQVLLVGLIVVAPVVCRLVWGLFQ